MKPCISFAIAMTAISTLARAQGSMEIDQDAISALNKMGVYLHTLKAFQVQVDSTKEDVFENGQKAEYGSHVDMLARAPDRMRVEVVSDAQKRLMLYNGKEFTLFGERIGYYATVPAPPSIAQLVEHIRDKYDIDAPLIDLFYWGTEKSAVKEIKGAVDLGPASVEEITCEQYAFRQNGLDWQIWIQQGEFPLPRKLVITTTTDEARPQYRAIYTWNLTPSFNDATFTFDPPKDAQRIAIAEVK